MGTGILAITSKFYTDTLPWLESAAIFLGIINLLIFIILLIPWTWRWLAYKKDALADLHNPIIGHFFATMPIACLVLAADILIIGTDYLGLDLSLSLAKLLWLLGAILGVIFSITIPLSNFSNPNIKTDALNPAWFMPPVCLIVVPVAGSKLISYWPPGLQEPFLIANYIFWSCGFFLYLIISSACFYRFICCPPLPAALAPTMWINLGPIGVGTIALLNLASASEPYLGTLTTSVLNMVSLLIWGFGIWWLLMALLTTLSYVRKNNLPYAMSWWAFTFPLGAYTGSTYLIANIYNLNFLKFYGLATYWLLVIFWLIVTFKTLIHLRESLSK